MSRLIWFHVPPKLAKDKEPNEKDSEIAMQEKRMAVRMLEG